MTAQRRDRSPGQRAGPWETRPGGRSARVLRRARGAEPAPRARSAAPPPPGEQGGPGRPRPSRMDVTAESPDWYFGWGLGPSLPRAERADRACPASSCARAGAGDSVLSRGTKRRSFRERKRCKSVLGISLTLPSGARPGPSPARGRHPGWLWASSLTVEIKTFTATSWFAVRVSLGWKQAERPEPAPPNLGKATAGVAGRGGVPPPPAGRTPRGGPSRSPGRRGRGLYSAHSGGSRPGA